MWLLIMILVIGTGIAFAVKRPLKLDSSIRTAGQPVACPSCGGFFTSPAAADAIVRCAECGAYARVEPGPQVAAIAPDFVAPGHEFQTYLPEAPRWPARCCVCGALPTHAEALSISYKAEPTFEEKLTAHAVVGVASLGTMKVAEHHVNVTERYRVPHCDAHAGGAQLAPAGVAFRSYAYYRQFVDGNRATIGG